MVNQSVWIGIVVGVFFVGLAGGYAILAGSTNPSNMPMQNQQTMMQDPQFRQQMMEQFLDDPQIRNQMMDSMIQDPPKMRSWMEDTKHVEEMAIIMRENHDFAMGMMTTMIEDPGLRLQMIGHMTENPEAMQQITNMMNSGMGSQGMMNSGMMMGNMSGEMIEAWMQGQGIMMNQEMMMQMMQNPETREKIIQIMSEHVTEMQELLSSELTGDEFNTKMIELMQDHMKEMQDLMLNPPMHQSMK